MHIRSRALSCAAAVAAVVLLGIAPVSAAQRPVMAEDLFKLSLVSSAQISHDGKRVAFVVTKLDGPKNTYLNNLWVVDVESGKVWQLTRGDSDGDPSCRRTTAGSRLTADGPRNRRYTESRSTAA